MQGNPSSGEVEGVTCRLICGSPPRDALQTKVETGKLYPIENRIVLKPKYGQTRFGVMVNKNGKEVNCCIKKHKMQSIKHTRRI